MGDTLDVLFDVVSDAPDGEDVPSGDVSVDPGVDTTGICGDGEVDPDLTHVRVVLLNDSSANDPKDYAPDFGSSLQIPMFVTW